MRSFVALIALGLTAVRASVVDQELDEGIPDTGLSTAAWTTGTVPPLTDMWTVNDFQIAAKNAMSAQNYAYYRTAALDEIAYIKNLKIWEKIRLNGFTFQDVSNVNLATTILGYNFSAPFFIAPAAAAGRAHPNAERNLVGAAANASVLYVPSISSTLSIEQIAAAAVPGQVMFHQEYCWANRTRIQDELRRIEAGGFKAIVLTVDNHGTNAIRTRYMRFTGFSPDTEHSETFTIQTLKEFQAMTKLPVIPKGVKTAHDVKLLADLGFKAVYLSNHGGRQVDLVPTAVEILLDLHAHYPEVFNQMEIYADGGVRRSTHVLTLLALGARAVGLGRSPMFANVLGQAGVARLLDIMRQEMVTEMISMGQANINGYRGNTTFINTKEIELEYFGAPLSVSTSSTPFVLTAPPAGLGK